MEIDAISAGVTPGGAARSATDGLDADDFLKLLVTQLANQDPLEPTSNEALLNQLSSIRDIQLSSELADSLKTLTGNQRFGAAAALMGKEVSGHVGDDADETGEVRGRVVGIRFDTTGRATLELHTGETLPLDRLESVSDSEASASSLLGQFVRGRSGADANETIAGIVTAVRRDDTGGTTLELDTGEALRVRDLIAAA